MAVSTDRRIRELERAWTASGTEEDRLALRRAYWRAGAWPDDEDTGDEDDAEQYLRGLSLDCDEQDSDPEEQGWVYTLIRGPLPIDELLASELTLELVDELHDVAGFIVAENGNTGNVETEDYSTSNALESAWKELQQ